MLHVNLKPQDGFSKNSSIIQISKGETYEVFTTIIGEKGEKFCAYFGIVFLDENGIEKNRRIKWLNDFSGQKKTTKIIFKALTNRILLIYRINNETPKTSEYIVDLEPINQPNLTNSHSEENFDDLTDYDLPRKKELTTEEEDMLEKNLVWVFGSPRSGTSWLALQLLSYNTHSIDHLHITEHLGTPHVGILDLTYSRWFDQCKKVNGYFFNDIYKKTWTYYLRKLILNRIYAQVGDFNKKIILKEPSVASGADVISESLPNSKIIFLFRDGRDVIDSILDARQKDGFMTLDHDSPPITKDNRFNFIVSRAKLWKYLIGNLLETYKKHSQKLRISIKYEDLLDKPQETLKTIYDFLAIEIDDKKINHLVEKFNFENIPQDKKGTGKFARMASPGKWKENFDENEKKVLEEFMMPTLNELGYE